MVPLTPASQANNPVNKGNHAMWIEYIQDSSAGDDRNWFWRVYTFLCAENDLVPISHQPCNESFWLVPGTYQE